MGQSSETMEEHSHKLNDKNQTEEEDENQTDGLQLKVLFADQNLKMENMLNIKDSFKKITI